VSHSGGILLRGLTDRLGLAQELSEVLLPGRLRQSRHDPGSVLVDLAVAVASGGDCMADLAAVREELPVGQVASDATAWRTVARVGEAELAGLESAVAATRQRAWAAGARPKEKELVLDLDTTLVDAHSEKQGARGTYKKGFGFSPFLCTLANTGEILAATLRPGNRPPGDVTDHLDTLDRAFAQIPEAERSRHTFLVRADSAGASHQLLFGLRQRGLPFSVSTGIYRSWQQAILELPEGAWVPAMTPAMEEREGAAVAEVTSRVDLSAWPPGTRLLVRREEPHPGAPVPFTDPRGFRFQAFLTDQPDQDLAYLDARHRGHADVENRIRRCKASGLRNLPFSRYAHNQVWLWLVALGQDLLTWLQRLCLRGTEAFHWEPKRMWFRLLHTAGRYTRSGRRTTLHCSSRWPWSYLLVLAFRRLAGLTVPV
jgi:hypothetical protein